MQPNPLLTLFKGVAFLALAFLVGLSTCQGGNLEDKVTALNGKVSELSGQVEELARVARRSESLRESHSAGVFDPAGSTPSTSSAYPSVPQDLDPSRALGALGRYPNFLETDTYQVIPAEAAGHDDGSIGLWYGPEPKGFNFVTENEGSLSSEIETYVGGAPAERHVQNPSIWGPSLCWRVEVSPDFKEYTLFFRKDATWHTPPVSLEKYPHLRGRRMVTGKDYKFTLDIIQNPQTDCAPLRGYFRDVESVELIDDHTVVVRWSKTLFHSLAYTLGIAVMPEFVYAYGEDGRRFPESTVGQSFNDHFLNRECVVGCGPYRFASFEPGQRILLERFEDWFGIREGKRYPIQERRLLIYPDPVTNLLKIRDGEVEWGGLTPSQYKEEILDNTNRKSPFKNGEIVNWRGPESAYLYIAWKNTNPLFRDKNVRKALTYACNRFEICEKIFLGRYEPMSSPVYPRSLEADPDLKPLPFDLEKAAELLDEAGWKRGEDGRRRKVVDGEEQVFEFTLAYPSGGSDFPAALNQFKNDLLSIGIKMRPEAYEWTVFQKKLRDREFNAYTLLWLTSGWEHDFDQIWHSRGIADPGSSNSVEFSNETVDRLSDQLRVTMDPEERIKLVREIGRTLYEEQPYTFFGWRTNFNVARSYVKNAQYLYRITPFDRTFPMWIEK